MARITASLSYSFRPGQTSGVASPAPSAMPAQVWAWRLREPVMTASKRSPRAAQ
jgi:hypothetical protein